MKVRLKKKNWNIQNGVKSGGLIVLVLAAMVLFSGCVGQNNIKSAANSPHVATTSAPAGPSPLGVSTPKPLPGYTTATTPKPTATAVPTATAKAITQPAATTPAFNFLAGMSELLIQPSDVPALTLKEFDFIGSSEYKNSYPPAGTPITLQVSTWQDSAGKTALYVIASPETDVVQPITGGLQTCAVYKSQEASFSCGTTNFGERSYYMDLPVNYINIPGYLESDIVFQKGYYYASIKVYMAMADKDKIHSEAFRIAGLVESRLK
jgi:hypothetical protein